MNKVKLTQLTLIFLGIFIALQASAQEKYHILHVKGDLRLKNSGEVLQPKDIIKADDQLIFGSKDAMAAAISSKRGRYMLRANLPANQDGELIALVKDVLLESSGKLSSRNALNTYFELNNYLKGDHVFLGDSAFILINTENMPMSDTEFFFLRYNYKGESINKRLSFSGNKLFFIPDEIYQVDEQPIDPSEVGECQLVHYNVFDHTVQESGSFNLIFPDNQQLDEELKLMVSFLEDQSQEFIKKEVYAYIGEVYGKVYEPGFEVWFKAKF